jgi:hypothetical protein
MQPRGMPSDKRPTPADNANYRLAYGVLAFGVLASVAYRGFVFEQDNWDLLLLVMASEPCW